MNGLDTLIKVINGGAEKHDEVMSKAYRWKKRI
jgi:hypothetical protein